MNEQRLVGSHWTGLLAGLPVGLDLEISARQSGLFSRVRAIRTASDLLRLILVYGYCGLSLRQAAAWAEVQGMASLSAQAVMKQLQHAAPWMKVLLGALLTERSRPMLVPGDFRLILIDATCIQRPGKAGPGWRVHLGFDPVELCISHVLVTDTGDGETLTRHPISPGDLVIGDTGYAHRRGFWATRDAGGDFLVRLNWQNVPLLYPDGTPFDILQALRSLDDTAAGDFPVLISDDPTGGGRHLHARLVAVRKSPEAAEKAREKVRRARKREGTRIDPRTLEAAGYVFVLTSVSDDRLPATAVLETYRFRWQVELTFKRLKSLLHLDELPAKGSDLAQTFICAKLLAAILLDRLAERSRDFSPWGRDLQVSLALPVAYPTGARRGAKSHHSRRTGPLRLAAIDRC